MIDRLVAATLVVVIGSADANASDQLVEALIFVTRGIEEGMPQGLSSPVKRRREGDRIIYNVPSFEKILVDYGKGVAPCVIELGKTFHGKDIEPERFDLNKVTKFELARYYDQNLGHYGYVRIEGGDAYCFNGECTRTFGTFAKYTDKHFYKTEPDQLELLRRYENAIEFIRRQCPGRPY